MEIYKKNKTFSKDEAIQASTEYFKGDKMAAEVWLRKYALRDVDGNIYELTPDDMHNRIANEFHRIEEKYKHPMTKEEIFDVIKNFKYLIPQGSPMAGIGNNFQTVSVSNCFVIGNKKDADSYGGIMKLDQELVQLEKRRAGVGLDLSFVRPEGSIVKNSALTSTGVVPFMERFSNSTREVAQGGRRGALMESISIVHPDAEKFIDAKTKEGKVTGANISVKITDDFMKAALANKNFKQQYPIESDSPKVLQEVNAKQIWDKIVHNAWQFAEPGVLFWDNVIKESVPDCYADLGYKTVSTNPCGEIPLCPGDSCRLLAINLYSYVKNPFTLKAYFDFSLFKEHVRIAMRLMDDLVDLELEKIDSILNKIKSDPEDEKIKRVEFELWEEIKSKAEKGRRTGLGITAEGDMLAALGITYGSDEGIMFSEKVHKTLKLEAYRSSVEMAKERGTFKIWEKERESKNPFLLRIKKEDPKLYEEMNRYGRRNIALLTIAPTGTSSMMTQTTSGIEPVFLPVYKRRRKINPQEKNTRVDFTDKQGDTWQEYTVFHHKFEVWLKINGYDIEETKNKTEEELRELIKLSPYYKSTSHDVDWVNKVKMQGVIQKHIDHSISVTVNLPKNISEDVVAQVYQAGWESGCKGITVYREGSRDGVLISSNDKKAISHGEKNAVKRPKTVNADVIRFNNNYEKWVAVIGKVKMDDDGEEEPYEFFTGKLDSFQIPSNIEFGQVIKRRTDKGSIYDFKYLDKDGFEVVMTGLSRSFEKEFWNYAKLISGLLRHRMPIQHIANVVKSLNLDNETLNTWQNGVVRILNKYVKDGTKSNNMCPHCGATLVFSEGCLKCESCGKYSKCG